MGLRLRAGFGQVQTIRVTEHRPTFNDNETDKLECNPVPRRWSHGEARDHRNVQEDNEQIAANDGSLQSVGGVLRLCTATALVDIEVPGGGGGVVGMRGGWRCGGKGGWRWCVDVSVRSCDG